MEFIKDWDLICVSVDNENCKTYCCICGKPAQYVNIFTERGVCSLNCARIHKTRIENLMIKNELNFEDCI